MSKQPSNQPPRRTEPGSMGGPPGPMGMGEKPKNFKDTLGKLLRYLGGYRIALLVIMLFAIASTVFSILGPSILGSATTEVFNGVMAQFSGTGSIDFGLIGSILLTLLVIYLLSALFSFIQSYMMSTVSNRITYKLRNDIDEKIFTLPFSYYDRVPNGEVLSRLTNDVDSINQGLNQSITQFITSIASILGILVMMFLISWQMTLVALVSLPVSMSVVMGIAKKSQKHFKNQQKYLGVVNGLAEETYSCHNIVKAFNGEERASQKFTKNNDVLYQSAWRANFLSGMMMPLMNFIGNLSYVAVCILGGYFATRGTITIGNIQAFIQYVRSFNQPISQLSQMSNVIQQTIAAAERVFEFLEEPQEVPNRENALVMDDVDIQGNVTFDHVNFGYIPEKTIINDFSAQVKPGQKIAIVGPTGAGKTTMIKLLMRFYDVNSGGIFVDGQDIRSFDREELRKAFGMVLQETWLFGGTIAENIRYGKLDATDGQVREAAKIAQADHFIRTLPNGYDMELNEEASNVSQGQKQLLTIARAVLADPKILILDEATSSVDTRTEQLIQKAMDNLMQGRTSFVIAHRLSTIRNADLILVMKDGDILEQGSHDDLIGQDGFYATLYNSQFIKSNPA